MWKRNSFYNYDSNLSSDQEIILLIDGELKNKNLPDLI